MALVPQEIEVPLNLGMATKPSAELAAPDAMRLVENLHWRGQGEIEKRGTASISSTVTEPTGSLYDEADACGLIYRANSAAVVTGKHGVAVYSEKLGSLQFTHARGTTPETIGTLNYCPVSYDVSRTFVERSQGNRADSGIYQVASAQYSGVHVIAWIARGSTERLLAKAIDVDTGAVIATTEFDNMAGAVGTWMVQACEYTEVGKEGVLIAYLDDATGPMTVSTMRYDHATKVFVADSALATNAVGQTFHIVKNGTGIYFSYYDTASGFLKVESRTIDSVTTTHTATHGATAVEVVPNGARTIIVSCEASTAYLEVFGQPASSNTIAASGENFFKITAALETRIGTSNDVVVYISAITTTTPTSTRVHVYESNFTGDTPTAPYGAVLPHCATISNAFTLRGMAHVVLTVYPVVNTVESTSATSCFVARFRSNGTGWIRHDAVAKLAHDRYFITNHLTYDFGGIIGQGKQGNSIYVDSNNNAWLALTADPSPSFAIGGFHYPQTIFLERISAARPMPMPYCTPEPGITFVAGGVPWEFDGDMATEAAPLVPPVAIADVSAGSGFTPTQGGYGIIPMYVWTDAAGRLHRMPGAAISTGNFTDNQIDVYVSVCPMRAYGHTTVGLDMEPQLYITEDGGSTYYLARDSSSNVDKYDSLTSDDLWYKFTAVRPANTAAPPYPFGTAPLELSPEPTPAFFHVAKVVDRLWAVDAEDRSRIWYSKPLVAGFAVEWTTANTLTIGDEATAVVDMGGGACILARNGIYLVDGEGPDATGAGGFSPARKLNHAVDCIDPVSVCRSPLGVIFRGRRGFYLLSGGSGGLEAQPFGVPIDPEVLTDASLDPSVSASYRMRVIFLEQTSEIQISGIPSGHRLVYNILEQKWSRFAVPCDAGDASLLESVSDLAVVRGKAWRLARVNSADRLRDEELFSHSASYNVETVAQMQIDTPWYRLDEVNGMVRLWRAWFAFKLPSDIADVATFTIRYYVDNNDTVAQTVTFTGAELAALYSTTSEVARLPFQPNVQTVRSFRFSLQWATTIAASAGPKPLSMRLQFGVRPTKGKQNKIPVKG